MQKGQNLEFTCQGCEQPVAFSIFKLDETHHDVFCENCHKKYAFDDEILLRQLKKFVKLCQQIHESEEILGNTSVGIDVGAHHVNIPYKLLLTRLSSSLDLMIGDTPFKIQFRIEPVEEISNQNPQKKKGTSNHGKQ